MSTRRSYKVALALLLILLLAGGLRLYNLGGESLWHDETVSVYAARSSVSEILTVRTRVDLFPPLYHLMLHGWIRLVGDSAVAVRVPSVIFGIAAVAVLFLVGRELRDDALGLVVAFLSAISYFLIRYAQEARPYSLLVLLSLASYYFFIRMVRRGATGGASVGYAATTALLLYTHYHATFLVLTQVCTVACLWRRLGRIRLRWVAAVTVASLAFSPWLPILRAQYFLENEILGWIPVPTIFHLIGVLSYWVTFPWGSYVDPHSKHVLEALKLFPLLPLGIIFWVLVSVGCFVWARMPESMVGRRWLRPIGWAPTDETVILALWMIVPVLVPFAISHIGRPIFWPRYLIGAVPAFYLLLARGVVAFNRRWLAWSLSLAILILTVPGLARYYRVPMKEQVDHAARMVEQGDRQGDLLVLASKYLSNPFTYYYHGSQDRFTVDDRDGPLKVLRQLETAIVGHKRLWLIVAKARRKTAVRALRGLLPDGPIDERRFVGVRVLLYEIPPALRKISDDANSSS